jgi:hypothetical protein
METLISNYAKKRLKIVAVKKLAMALSLAKF